MKNKKRKNTMMLIIILVLAISVGFAALATTLKIIGTTNISKNAWNIYWDNIAHEKGVTPDEPTDIYDDEYGNVNTVVTWEVTFNKPGDFYEFEVDAVNAGTIDAEVLEIEKKYDNQVIPANPTQANPSPLPDYIKYTVKYANGKDIAIGDGLAKARVNGNNSIPTRRTYKIRVEYDKEAVTKKDINDQSGVETHTFDFKVKYGQSSNNDNGDPYIVINRQNPGQITPGDKVTIGENNNQEFYVISSDSKRTVLLAKYNLLVGNIVENGDITGQISTSESGYGLQSSAATGPYAGLNPYKGTVPFRETYDKYYGFWVDFGDESDSKTMYILPKYNENDYIRINVNQAGYPEPIQYNDHYGGYFKNRDGEEDYPYVYDEDSSISTYVEAYLSKLKTDFDMPSSTTARLLSLEEALATQQVLDSGTSIIYTGRQTYWLGSTRDYGRNVALIQANQNPGDYDIAGGYEIENTRAGVRPVIEIATRLLN